MLVGKTQKNKGFFKFAENVDPDELQALDECNSEWVTSWRKVLKKKRVRKQSYSKRH